MPVNLQELIRVKMDEEGLSLRKAGDQAGVAHTTIDRVLNGNQIDLKTLMKISTWLGIPASEVIFLKASNENLKSDVASLNALHPELGEVLSTLTDEIVKGNVSPTILAEITGFTAYRMKVYKEKKKKIVD